MGGSLGGEEENVPSGERGEGSLGGEEERVPSGKGGEFRW